MTALLILVVTFIFLIFTRRQINIRIVHISLLLTGSQKLGIVIYSLLFFPGTVIHELSHLLFALLLHVPSGKLNLIPSMEKGSRSISLGSVKIAKVDFVRQSIIGAAPTIVGVILIFALVNVSFASFIHPSSAGNLAQTIYAFLFNQADPMQLIALYFIFTISSTLHTSPSDRTGWPLLALLITLVLIAVYLLGGFQFIPSGFTSFIVSLSLALSLSFVFAILLNFLIISTFYFVETSLGFILGKHVVSR